MGKNTGECKKLHKRDTEGREKKGGGIGGGRGGVANFRKMANLPGITRKMAFFCQGNSALHTSGLLFTMPILDDLIKLYFLNGLSKKYL